MTTDATDRSAAAQLSAEQRALLFRQLVKKKQEQAPAELPLVPRERTDAPLPASFAQQRLWFLEQYEPGSPLYNIPSAFQISGELRPELLQQALDALVARHESLRTSFANADGKAMQVIHPEGRLALQRVDLRELPQAERKDAAERRMGHDARQPFDIATGPVARTMLLQLDDHEYIFYVNLHHIVADGWSIGVLIEEIKLFYHAFASGQSAPLPALPIQYADYALWQREWLQGPVLERQLAYWKQQLSGVPILQLATDLPRPAIRTPNGTMRTRLLPARLAQAAGTLSQQSGGTLFMTLLAAYKALLAHYTGQHDIAVGTMIANRNRREVEPLIGCFVNTLVLRTEFSDDPSFAELLARVRTHALGAYDHQDLPFEKLVEELNPERDLSRTPIFQTMFILQNAPLPAMELAGIRLRPIGVDSETSKLDLSLSALERPEGLQVMVEYNSDLFLPATIDRLLDHFELVLEQVTANPALRVSQLSLLSPAERRQILVDWNDTLAAYPDSQGFPSLFEAQVERSPEAIAVAFEQQELSYAQLNARANQLAHTLRARGLPLERPVALCLERSPELLVALLAVLKAGGCYVPLDPAYPLARLALMLDDAQPALIITQSAQRALLPDHPAPLIDLDAEQPAIDSAPQGNLDLPIHPQALAYIIYTSGSTGTPKGVMVSHANLINFLTSMGRAPGISPRDMLLSVTTISFDIAGLELYLPLLSGATVQLVSRDVASDGSQLAQVIAASRASLMQATPASWRLLLEAGWPGANELTVLCGGEALPRDLADTLRARTRALWNMYGPTETTIWSATEQVAEGPITLGRPIANTQIYVLDQRLQPVPIGVPGALYIGGDGLARGYRNRPELTAERFVPNPFGEEAGGRMYWTGDLARYRADGRLEYLGRMDHQVKVRGFRIELGEIEAALGEHPDVAQTVVVVREDRSPAGQADRRLVGYIVARGEEPSSNELRTWLKARLPAYMIPSAFVVMEAFPLTPNGKIDRKALPAPSAKATRAAYVEPRTPQERLLATIWGEVLGIPQIGAEDNFFEIGGDSLLVMRVVTKAKQAGLEITPKQHFQHQTVAELAAVAGQVRVQAEQGLVTGPVRLTPFMHVFFEETYPKDLRYHCLGPVLLAHQKLDMALLEQVLAALLLHHDALRLGIVQQGGAWGIVNHGPSEQVPLRRVDFTALEEAEQGPAMHAIFKQMMEEFDLERGPLLQAALIDSGPAQPDQLLLVGHYMPMDIQSWMILFDDIDMAYGQLSRGEALKLPAKSTSLQEWGERLAEYAATPAALGELDYWLRPARAQAPRLPVDLPGGKNTVASAQTETVFLSVEESRALLRVAQLDDDTQVDDILLSALLITFSKWTNGSSLLVDIIGHGREPLFEDIDLARTIGWLSSIYPLLLELKHEQSMPTILRSVKAQIRGMPNHGFGYDVLRYYSSDESIVAQLRAQPRPEVYFNYMGPYLPELSSFMLTQVKGGYFLDVEGGRAHLIQVNAYMNPGDEGVLRLDWNYTENLLQASTIQRLAQRYSEVLRTLVNHCLSSSAES